MLSMTPVMLGETVKPFVGVPLVTFGKHEANSDYFYQKERSPGLKALLLKL